MGSISLISPFLTPLLVGVQECSRGITSVASQEHFLTSTSKTSTAAKGRPQIIQSEIMGRNHNHHVFSVAIRLGRYFLNFSK